MAFRAAGSAGNTNGGTIGSGQGLALPSGWQAGDIHVLCVMSEAGGVGEASGFTQKVTANNNSGGMNMQGTILWRRAQAGDSVPTVTASGGANFTTGAFAFIIGFSGRVASGDPFSAYSSKYDQWGQAGEPQPNGVITGITPGASTDDLLAVAFTESGNDSQTFSSWSGTNPTWTEAIDFNTSNAANYINGAAAYGTTDGSATGDRTVTVGGTSLEFMVWVTFMLSLTSGAASTNVYPSIGTVSISSNLPLVNPQFSRPISDASVGSWMASGGGSLYAAVDETLRNDSDYILSSVNPSNDICILKLGAVADPGVDTGFQVQWAVGSVGSTGSVTGSLRQGNSPGTEIASWTHNNLLVGSFQQFKDGVTSAQAANITDFTDLYFKIVAN